MIWKELIEEERRYREKLIKVRAKNGRMPTPAECLEAMKEVLAEKRFEKAKAELTRGGGLVSRRFEWCENWRDIFEEWDEIMWILPKEEQAKTKLPARSPLTADELRRLIPGAPDAALAALVLKAQLIAHPDHWRPRLVVNNPRVDAKQVAELNHRRLRLVWDRDQIEPPQV